MDSDDMAGIHGIPGLSGLFGSSFGGGSGFSRGNPFGGAFGGAGDGFGSAQGFSQGPPPPQQAEMYCSLEELYKGVEKKLKITRKVSDGHGKTRRAESLITVPIKAGFKAGTKITYPGEGDEVGGAKSDLVLILREKPHSIFTRSGNNLIVKRSVALKDALTGVSDSVRQLDGRVIQFSCNEVIKPGFRKTIPGEGMPISKSPGNKGDMIIDFDVVFPSALSTDQKEILRSVL